MVRVDPERPPGPLTPVQETKPASKPIPTAKPTWYELDYYVKFRDVFLVFGFGMLVGGIGHFNVWIALGVAGAGLMTLSYLLSGR